MYTEALQTLALATHLQSFAGDNCQNCHHVLNEVKRVSWQVMDSGHDMTLADAEDGMKTLFVGKCLGATLVEHEVNTVRCNYALESIMPITNDLPPDVANA